MLKVSFFPSRFHELPGGDMSLCTELAWMADDAGLYGVQLGDHLIVGNRRDRYPYGTYRHEEDCPWLEPVATLSAMAAVTTRIRLSMGVLLSPLRPAVLLAKQLATLDVLSRGRCEPGIGTGWQREEYEAMGLEWGQRQQTFEEGIAACRALWGEQPVTFQSNTVHVTQAYAMPKPVQSRIPILYGVRMTPSNAEMVARLGDGWTPVASIEETMKGTDLLRQAFLDAGRDPSKLIIRGGLPTVYNTSGAIDVDRTVGQAPQYLEAGATVLTVALPVGYGALFKSMSDLGNFVSELGRRAETEG